ncbi:hypothetical protein [Pseudomonas sp. R76]|uniref:hypothetical protein n=1 Tax=Pseudomonas sp. R76 TaxID=1573711 RepID=UPI001359CC72|nr:hypothetical protein [Pseudomonas sp. R76]
MTASALEMPGQVVQLALGFVTGAQESVKSDKTFCVARDSQLGAITPAERGVKPD